MRPFLLMFLLIFTMAGFPQEADSGNEDAKMVQKIFEECLVSGDTYHLLEHLCTEIGPRLSGSQGAADAVAWTRQVMSDYGFDRVFLQEVMALLLNLICSCRKKLLFIWENLKSEIFEYSYIDKFS